MPINFKRKLYFLAGLCIICIIYIVERKWKNFQDFLKLEAHVSKRQKVKRKFIYIKISGAIKHSGRYKVRQGTVLRDVLKLAQPLDIAGKFNPKLILIDGKEYYIPFRKLQRGEKIDINKAGKEELFRVPGITSQIVTQILLYREKYERFDEIEELKEIKGMGNKYNKIKEYFYIGE